MKYTFIILTLFTAACGKPGNEPSESNVTVVKDDAVFSTANGLSIGLKKFENTTYASLHCLDDDTIVSGTCICMGPQGMNDPTNVTRRKNTYDKDNATHCECNEPSTIQLQIYCTIK